MPGNDRKKIILLGMLTRHPVAGMVWLTMQYMVGFERLGYETYYVEAHGGTPKMFMRASHDGSVPAAAFLDRIMRSFGFHCRWAFHALHSDGTCYGLSRSVVKKLYESACLVINLHGATTPLPEHTGTGRLVYLGTDPVEREIEVHHKVQETIDLLQTHDFHFTWAGNYGNPDCRVPVCREFDFRKTRQPIVLDLWEGNGSEADRREVFTTIANWKQLWREIRFDGEVYHWSKHFEFLKFVDLPRRTVESFELALSGCSQKERQELEGKGWRVRDALVVSRDVHTYRDYVRESLGEFTVAKDQNVRLRSGWFSDRSAAYLAAGRPVITQDTGFGNALPTGEGLFAYSDFEGIEEALGRIGSDYAAHSRASTQIAREYFSHEIVLGGLLSETGN